jgi:glutathione S-transferase
MITLYGSPHSTCTRKVLMTLHEKHAAFDFRVVDLAKGEQKSPEHLARQPFGVVPVIDHDDFRLYESRAIIRYVDRALPGPALTPTDPREAARMEQFISIEQGYFSGPALTFFVQKMKNPRLGIPTDPAKIEEARAKLGPVSDVLAARLEETPYLAGATFSLAVVTFMTYVAMLFMFEEATPITSRPALLRWWTSVSERPAWKKVVG